MNIKTRYSMEDEVWFADCGQILKGEINGITVKEGCYSNYASLPQITYSVYTPHQVYEMISLWIYPTKEELIKALIKSLND